METYKNDSAVEIAIAKLNDGKQATKAKTSRNKFIFHRITPGIVFAKEKNKKHSIAKKRLGVFVMIL